MDLHTPALAPPAAAAAACSICLDPVLDRGDRSIAKLHCGHDFHLDCIGSAFNAKGAMQCPNCRKVEKGQWLYANGQLSSSDFDIEGFMAGDVYELGNADIPLGFQWCPFGGITQLSSVFEEGDTDRTFRTLGDHSSVSSSSHVCPYIALRGFLHPLLPTSSSTTSGSENISFPRHTMEAPPSIEQPAPAFHMTEPRIHNMEQQYLSGLHSSGFVDQSATDFSAGLPRFGNIGGQQNSRPYIHPNSSHHRPGSNLFPRTGPSALMDFRGHSPSLVRSQGYHQPARPVMQSNPYAPARRVSPSAVTITSSFITAASLTATDIGTPRHGFTVSGALSWNLLEGEVAASGHANQSYWWGQDANAFAHLPWIPMEGESRLWGPFNPNQSGAHPRSYAAQRPSRERAMQGHGERGYHLVAPLLMPPYL